MLYPFIPSIFIKMSFKVVIWVLIENGSAARFPPRLLNACKSLSPLHFCSHASCSLLPARLTSVCLRPLSSSPLTSPLPLFRFCQRGSSPLFSLSTVWNVVLSIVLPCNCDTSSSVGLAVRSPYLLRLHSVSPPQSAPEAQRTQHHHHHHHHHLFTPSYPQTPGHPPHIHPSLHPLPLGKHTGLTPRPLLFLGRHVCYSDTRVDTVKAHPHHIQIQSYQRV